MAFKLFSKFLPLNVNSRNISIVGKRLEYQEHGEPVNVIVHKLENLGDPKDDEVLVEMLAAPINPADINTIQGKYPVHPVFPAVPGNEGVGNVLSVGKNVKNFKEGDRVVPLISGLGTWRTHVIFKSSELLCVPSTLGLIEAATLTVNPCTAYRMLKDYKILNNNTSIIQNGANSAVGQSVIQICKAWGIPNVAVMRNRPEISKLKNILLQMGATEVLTEEELISSTIFKSNKLPKPCLALNCVGGKSASGLLRQLDSNGTMVTYGGMSREPVTVPTRALIFKDISFRGFWMSKWSKEHKSCPSRALMFAEVIDLMQSHNLSGPTCKLVPFDNYLEALSNTLTEKGFIGRKFLLDFKSPCTY